MPAKLATLCAHRALLQLQGRYMPDYILQALAGTPAVAASALVAPQAALEQLGELPGIHVPAGDSIVENMQRGARALAQAQPTHLLFVTGDLPLINPLALGAYIDASLQSGAALTYPIIPREASERLCPGGKRTYVQLQEGTFTGGNLIFTTASLLEDKQALIEHLFAARKNPLQLAGIFGWATVARMLTGKLTLPYLEGIASRILGAPAKALITPHPEIGFDVDKPEDLALVTAVMAQQG